MSLIVTFRCRGWLGQKLHWKDTFYRVTSRLVDTRCYSLIPPKNLSIKILMLTDLIIESAIGESGEKRSSLEMSRNIWWYGRHGDPDLLFVHLFLIFNRQSSSVSKCKNVHNCLNKTDYWGKNLNIYLDASCDYFNKSNNNIIIVIYIYIYIYIYIGQWPLTWYCRQKSALGEN